MAWNKEFIIGDRPCAGMERGGKDLEGDLEKQKSCWPSRFTGEFYQMFKWITTNSTQLHPRGRKRGNLPSLYYEVTITLIRDQTKAVLEKLQTSIPHEHRSKIFKQNFSKHNSKIYKKNYILWPRRVKYPGMQSWLDIQKSNNITHHINGLEKNNPMIKRKQWQNSIPIHDKNWTQVKHAKKKSIVFPYISNKYMKIKIKNNFHLY